MSHVFDFFGFMLEFTKPSVVELSILRGVGGCLLPRPMREGIIATPSLAFQNVPVVSASASEETTLQIVLHVVRIGTFRLVDGRLGLSRGQSLR